MKRRNIIAVVAVVAVCLTAGLTGIIVHNNKSDGKEAGEIALAGSQAEAAGSQDDEESGNTKSDILKAVGAEGTEDADKEETVYIIADTDGSAKKVIVSDWLKNKNGEDVISDVTELSGVFNVKGDETFTSEDGQNLWQADGNDIYYQGTTDKELPVEMSISYKLNGKDITAGELAGQSGKVTIRYDFTNKMKETVTVDDKEEDVYVPFIMVTGMILDNEKFTDIEVSNGKVINDGDRSVACGFALPGMQENLDIDEKDLEIPSYIEITANVTDFSLDTSITLAANSIFSDLNLKDVDTFESLEDSLWDLSDASDELVDGSSELYKGILKLSNKSGDLIEGIDKLEDGAYQLKEGADQLKKGADQLNEGAGQLKEGISDLDGGLGTLAQNNESLQNGAYKVFLSMLSSADEKLAAKGLDVPKLTIDNYEKEIKDVKKSLKLLGVKDSDQRIKNLNELLSGLKSYNEFYDGLIEYTNGVESAKKGSGQLVEGAGELSKGAVSLSEGAGELSIGAGTLYGGMGDLKIGADALIDGIDKLKKGAKKLSEGMDEFNREGISKLVNAVDGDVDGLITRFQATSDASKAYQSFAGISEDMKGTVSFIYRTEAIE